MLKWLESAGEGSDVVWSHEEVVVVICLCKTMNPAELNHFKLS